MFGITAFSTFIKMCTRGGIGSFALFLELRPNVDNRPIQLRELGNNIIHNLIFKVLLGFDPFAPALHLQVADCVAPARQVLAATKIYE